MNNWVQLRHTSLAIELLVRSETSTFTNLWSRFDVQEENGREFGF